MLVATDVPARADDSEHSKALEELTAAIKSAPRELGIIADLNQFKELTADELRQVKDFLPTRMVFETSDLDVSATTASTCKTNWAVGYGVGGLTKIRLWRFRLEVEFCYDSGAGTVTSIETPTVEGYVYGPAVAMGWKYRGLKNGPTNVAFRDAYGIAYYETYAQVSFEGCPIRLSCTVEMHPWIKLYSHRDGSTAAELGGF